MTRPDTNTIIHEVRLNQFALNEVYIDLNRQMKEHLDTQKAKTAETLMPFVVDIRRSIAVYVNALEEV